MFKFLEIFVLYKRQNPLIHQGTHLIDSIDQGGPPNQRYAFRCGIVPGTLVASMHVCMQLTCNGVKCACIYLYCTYRPEAKHQSFKRMSKSIYWPQMLTQMVQKHNMRNAWELMEQVHVNHQTTVADGSIVDDRHILRPSSTLYSSIVKQSKMSGSALDDSGAICIFICCMHGWHIYIYA